MRKVVIGTDGKPYWKYYPIDEEKLLEIFDRVVGDYWMPAKSNIFWEHIGRSSSKRANSSYIDSEFSQWEPIKDGWEILVKKPDDL